MNYLTWHKTASWATLLTGCIHSLNFLSEPQPQNETEKQLFDLLENYKFALPGGFERSMGELMLFFNLDMSIFLISWGIINLFIARYFMPSAKDRPFLWLNLVVMTIYLVATYLLTFLIPLMCVGIMWLFFAVAAFTYKPIS